jgi:phosphorylcholine metabolism protein LicD
MRINSVKFTRLFIKKRRPWVLSIILLSLFIMTFIKRYQSERKTIRSKPIEKISSSSSKSLPFTNVKLLLDQLFDPLRSLIDIQLIWNKLLKTWHEVLIKCVHDACELCHENHSDCYESIDLSRYIYQINESFYPFDETKRPSGMGIYYYFDLKTLHSLNDSILSSDVSYCDYFHMIQLMINVQLILHQSQIKYFVTKGTLIGVLRHHDVIPWDSDIDLFIPKTATNKLLTSFRQIDLSLNQASLTTDSIRSAKE